MTGWSASDSLRMLARRYHDERCQKRLAAGIGVGLGRLEPLLVGGPRRDERGRRPVGGDGAAVERLGRRPERLRAEAERLALVGRSADPTAPSPEKTVRIVTFWPSSRRLAMRPPHESATSSGCGATKTWVMAGRVYRASRAGSRVRAGSSEPARRPGASRPPAGAALVFRRWIATTMPRRRPPRPGSASRSPRPRSASGPAPRASSNTTGWPARGPGRRARPPFATGEQQGDERDRDEPRERGRGQAAVRLRRRARPTGRRTARCTRPTAGTAP